MYGHAQYVITRLNAGLFTIGPLCSFLWSAISLFVEIETDEITEQPSF